MKTLFQMLAAVLCQPLMAANIPDPLLAPDGTTIKTSSAWESTVRPATLNAFRKEIYGVRPIGRPSDFAARVVLEDPNALDGAATVKEIEISYSGPNGKGAIHPLLVIPNAATIPVPAFLLIHFRKPGFLDPKSANGDWPVKEIIARGYAAVAFDFNDVEPDRPDGIKAGVRGMFGSDPLSPDAWGALSAWGWGASRVMDYLETDKAIDAKHVAIIGHSRAGKAAAWCGAEDERFAMVVSNNSGCSGAGFARTKKGERVANITNKFPYWFCENYRKFADKEDNLPVDQHQLLGLIAPRLLYVASATQDQWSDPESEFKSCVLAAPVFKLFGKQGLQSDTMPAPDQAMLDGTIGYHLRTGKHDLLPSDWQHYMDFADKHWGVPNR